MRIMLMGSEPEAASERSEEQSKAFRQFCRRLGGALARAGHELLIMSDAEDTFDYHAVLGADGASGKITAVWPKDKRTKTPQIPGLKTGIYCIPSDSGLSNGRLHQIRLCDLVLMVGGNDKTREALPLCLALEKPFLPIPQLDGTARDVFSRLMEILEDRHKELADALRDMSRLRIFDGMSERDLDKVCNSIIELIKLLRKNNPSARENLFGEVRSFVVVLMSAGMAIAGGWLSYKYTNLLPILLSLFGAILLGSVLSAYFGPSGMAGTYAKSGGIRIVRNSTRGAIVSVATLAVMAFAQFPTTGKVNPTAFLDEGGDYVRLAVVVFLVGFACAWRYESWEDGLERRLHKFGGSLQ